MPHGERITPSGLRILITSRSYAGHFLPLLPLARALTAAGCEVACASGAGVRMEAERAGLTFFEAGPDQLTERQRSDLFPEIATLKPHEIREFFFSRVFVEHEVPLRAPGLATAIDRWRPDVVIHEVAELAAPMVATSRRLPYATHSYGAVLAHGAVSAAAAAARPLWEAAGLEPHPRAGLWEHLYVDICPPTLQESRPEGARAIQQMRPNERGDRRSLTKPPQLYVTLGTVYNTDVALFRTIIDGVASEAVSVVVTVGPRGNPDLLRPHPPNVRIERFIPQAELLPTCSVVITHGGAGTMFGALTFGCPILFLPRGADQFGNAARAVAAGVGLQILPAEVSAESVRHAVSRLLNEPSFEAAALKVSDEIASMPPPTTAAAAVIALCGAMWRVR